MYEFPCLIFDENAHLQSICDVAALLPDMRELTDAEARFLEILRAGDRKRFTAYCAEPLLPDSDSVPCEIFSIIGRTPFRFAFCEKNASGGKLLNTVFLAEDIGHFYRLMSPVSLGYSRTTDRMIREILFLAGDRVPSSLSLTPETILALRYLPTVLQSVMAPGRGSGLCDVFRITKLVVQNLSETPLFLHTALSCPSEESDPALRIIELSADVYIHILTSLLTALLTISADHAITVEVTPFAVFIGNAPLSIDVRISTRVRNPGDYRNDSGTLRSLARPGSTNETLLSVAAVLAYTAGIETSVDVDYGTQSLNIYLTINPECSREIPGFKYRDPYQSVGTVLTEFFGFLESL